MGLAGRNPQGLPCPTCRRVTPIPPAGVAGLQPAFQTNSLLEILQEHKKGKQDILYCPQHHNRELELYCETCDELICFQCTIQQHNGHKYNLIGEVFEKHKQEIMTSLNPVEQQLTLAKKSLEMMDVRSREITDQQTALQTQIHKSSQQLHEIIDLREKELTNHLNFITEEKLSILASQREQIKTTLAQLNSCLDMVKENLRPGSQGMVLRMKTTLLEQVKDLTSSFHPDILKPNTEADMTFSSSHTAAEECHAHGLVSAPTVPVCHALSGVPHVMTVGEKSTTLIQVNTYEGKPLDKLVQSLECELVSELTGTRASCSVERKGQSQYEVSYQSTIKGRHQLHIKVMGKHIRASPYSVAVKSPVKKLGTPILTIDGVRGPWGVAVNQRSGEVVVTEWESDCVSVFSPSGHKLRSFGTLGSDKGQFEGPRGVVVDGEGNILVTDYGNHRIQKFTAEGQFLTAVGTEGSGPLQFRSVVGIDCNAINNKVYVVDMKNHCVQVLNSDLTFSSTIGKQEGEFYSPWDITCDSTGNIYVADTCNHRVQVFTSTSTRMFGSLGRDGGKLNNPAGIALDEDKVYVSERVNCRVSVFTSEGQFVTSFGNLGEGLGEFSDPRGLAVDSNGVVYVCDYDNNRLQVF